MGAPGRNDTCPCWSGEKYKKCCGADREFADERAQALRDTDTAEGLRRAAEQLEALRARPNLGAVQRKSATIGLARVYQQQGRHHDALELLHPLRGAAPNIDQVIAISLTALGNLAEACALYAKAIDALESAAADPQSILYLDAGKAFYGVGDTSRAELYWKKAEEFYANIGDLAHLARTKADLGFLLLHSEDAATQARAIAIIEESSSIKRETGDLQGLANNYCNLALYNARQRRFGRAIAFSRKDIAYSRMAGDLSGLVTSLINIGDLYTRVRQLSEARRVVKEARTLAQQLKDNAAAAKADALLEHIQETGRLLGAAGQVVGPSAPCECGSGRRFDGCCGEADHEPVDHLLSLLPLEGIDEIRDELSRASTKVSFLDIVLRHSEDISERQAWTRIQPQDGWTELWELPDMSNLHLASARLLASQSNSDANTSGPLSCVLLSVAAAEAFINQVAFFIDEVTRRRTDPLFGAIPWPKDHLEKFLWTRLLDKWTELGQLLCGSEWPPPSQLWQEFGGLVALRNDLVHFKATSYERVVPPDPNDVLRNRVPTRIKIRDVRRNWTVRALTPEVAHWAVETADGMIRHFRQAFARKRRAGPPAKQGDESPNP